MAEFLFPDVGEGIHEGKLVSWKVKEGDTVKADQVLAEVETDKAVVELPSPYAGKISKLHAQEGSTIKVGEVLVTYDSEAGQNPAVTERHVEKGTSKIESTFVPKPPVINSPLPQTTEMADTKNQQGPISESPKRALAPPSVRRIARDKNIDINTIKGTGPNGRITLQDLEGNNSAPNVTAKPISASQTSESKTNQTVQSTPHIAHNSALHATATLPYSGRRKAVGEHMMVAQHLPAVTEFARADVTELVQMRERLKQTALESGIKITPLAFIAKAVTIALRKFPVINSELNENEIEEYSEVHLGIAVDTPKGLVVPVVKDAHNRDVLSIASEIQRLAELARSDKLTLPEATGSTFSISSIGPLRVEGFTPMLNTPEEATLGIGAIVDSPWVVDGKVEIRKIVTLSLTFDHRVIDGAESARFLTEIVNLIEKPELLLLGGI